VWCEVGGVCIACNVCLYIVSDDGCVSRGGVWAARGTRVAYVAFVALSECVHEWVARVACVGGAGVACGSFAVIIGLVVHEGCVPQVVRGTRVAYVACVARSACVCDKSVARAACGGGTGVACGLLVVSSGQVAHSS